MRLRRLLINPSEVRLAPAEEPVADIEASREEEPPSRDELMKKIINRFADECLEFSYFNMIHVRDVRLAYANWLAQQPDLKYDLTMTLRLPELVKIIPKYRQRKVSICKSCRQRIFKDCCEFHNRKTNQTTAICLINARLK
jgi:hypothetical protein